MSEGKSPKERPSSERGGLLEAREKKVVTRAVRGGAKRPQETQLEGRAG